MFWVFEFIHAYIEIRLIISKGNGSDNQGKSEPMLSI